MTQIFIENEINQIRSMKENQISEMYDNYNNNYNRNNYKSKKNINVNNTKSKSNINNNNNVNSRYLNSNNKGYNEFNSNINNYNNNNIDYSNPIHYTFGKGKNSLLKSGSSENNRTGRFNNIGSMIINGESKGGNQELHNEREFVDVFYPQKNDSLKKIKFNKEEYNKLSLDGKSVANTIKQSLNMINNQILNNTSSNNQSNASKGNLNSNSLNTGNNNLQGNINLSNFYIHNEEGNQHYQLSTIKNDNANNSEDLNDINEDKKILIGTILEDSMNALNNNLNTEDLGKDFYKEDDERPFSPPLTKIEEIKN